MSGECCSVCSKAGTKRCSKCKIQYYCSRECQMKDWKTHKRICTQTTSLKSSQPTTGISEQFSNDQHEHRSQSRSKLVPEYHKEYKKIYPRDALGYDKLRYSWIMANASNESVFGDSVIEISRDYGFEDRLKRWQYFGPELDEFLSHNPKPGDIFTNRVVNPYGTVRTNEGLEDTIVYQTMRNTPVQPMEFQFGNNYVFIGFVDLFPLLVGSFKATPSEANIDPITFIGYDKSEVVIARSLIIYEMMLQGVCAESILQVWFSTGWNENTQKDFKETCQDLLKKEDLGIDHRVKKLMKHWVKTVMSAKTVLPLWREFIQEYQMEPLKNLQYEKDRIDYARYVFTGHIFGKNDKDYIHGNVTMFSLPTEYDNYQRQDENFFAALSLRNFTYCSSLLASITDQFMVAMTNLMEHIKNQKIVCTFMLRDLSLSNKAALDEIKDLDAKVLDWSNIPDYLPAKDFFAMAKACDGTDTTHSLHYMNWQGHVFGTSLIDYPDKSRVFKDLKKVFVAEYQDVKKERPFLRQDQYLLYYMNVADEVLCHKYRQKFIDHVVAKDRDITISESTSEEFNPFERSSACFFVSFYFDK